MFPMENQVTNDEYTTESAKVNRKKYGGLPANAFFIPVVIILAISQVAIVMLMVTMFTQSGKLSQVSQEASSYVSEATSLIAGASLLSETSNNFVFMPVTPQGEPIVGPLVAYTNELAQSDHRGDQILAHFETYNVPEEVLQHIRDAAQSANTLIEIQTHALALTNSVYPLPDIPPLAGLQLPELSAEEAALSDGEKLDLARSLLLDSDFGTNRSSLSENVNAAVGKIQAYAGEQVQRQSRIVGQIRTLLIAISVSIVVFLAIALLLFYRFLIAPLGRFSRLIEQDDSLDDKHGLREMRVLAGSYNGLLHRRDALEDILREAAETDTLTGLPNRYSFKQHIVEDEDRSRTLTILLFDVDHLKITNDTYGHAAGDDLIRRAAHCIAESFASTDKGRCYRIAGDEFAAVIWDLDENEIMELTKTFEELQAQNDVNVSWGYAFSPASHPLPFRALMDEADQLMYKMKERVHQSGSHFGPEK